MAYDAHKNFAYSTVLTAPSPATSGTSLVVQSGDGAKFPTPPFNATIWPVGLQPTTTNAEIVRVTNISTDTLTITRAQESSSARTVIVGDQIAATVTVKTITDIEAAAPNGASTSYSPAWTGGSPVIGNGTLTGNYFQLGKLVFFWINLTAGSTTTFGSGAWFFSLPVTSISYGANIAIGQAFAEKGGAADYTGIVGWSSTTTVLVWESAIPTSAFGSATPVSWNSTTYLRLSGCYEAA